MQENHISAHKKNKENPKITGDRIFVFLYFWC